MSAMFLADETIRTTVEVGKKEEIPTAELGKEMSKEKEAKQKNETMDRPQTKEDQSQKKEIIFSKSEMDDVYVTKIPLVPLYDALGPHAPESDDPPVP